MQRTKARERELARANEKPAVPERRLAVAEEGPAIAPETASDTAE